MAAELVISATSEKLAEMDWAKNIEIYVDKQYGENVHKLVIDTGIITILVKIVKKKSDLPVRERIFLLLDATQTSLGGASGKFPQYYSAYNDLVSSGVEFPQRLHTTPSNPPASLPTKPNTLNVELKSARQETAAKQAEPQIVPESSIIQKANNALEVLKEVLDAIDTQNPQGAKDEFTLDLVEQCSFQKQQVMHLVMSSRDEKVVSRAIELNEQLQNVLIRHDALLSVKTTVSSRPTPTPIPNHFDHEEEEEPEQLFRRLRKGKACARPEDEEQPHSGLFGSNILGEKERLNRPLIRPLPLEPSYENNTNPSTVAIPPLLQNTLREKTVMLAVLVAGAWISVTDHNFCFPTISVCGYLVFFIFGTSAVRCRLKERLNLEIFKVFYVCSEARVTGRYCYFHRVVALSFSLSFCF
ncbi:anthocyanidin 5,3-O-glucosyltransferase-like [Hibiscus syriacus]|uniref:Anthocyanidin 5,3-O-glucosyltransferase-like n=1 Tax=Hibiscus syriacus TaxID=106335 RepID=A0A6A2WWU7_HIBSY|nr:anthocyanidin 5,3-O-glucosyltransferase-like [Hibiscus syriacus]